MRFVIDLRNIVNNMYCILGYFSIDYARFMPNGDFQNFLLWFGHS
jgi:hypothetical protein